MYEIYELEGGGGRVVGCAYGQARVYYLGPIPGGYGDAGGGAEPRTIVGTFVAGRSFGYGTVNHFVSTGVWVVDLRTGKQLHRWEVLEGLTIPSIVLKPNGSVAWIADSYVNTETGFHQEWVYALDRDGQRTLAHGSDIPDSLALAGSTVYWTEEGKPYSASLN